MNEINRIVLNMVKGDTFEFTVKFEDLSADLSAAAFTIKSNPTGAAVVQKTIANSGITKVSDGLYDVKVDPADTSTVAAGRYMYDLQVTESNGDVHTIMLGVMNIVQDVTN